MLEVRKNVFPLQKSRFLVKTEAKNSLGAKNDVQARISKSIFASFKREFELFPANSTREDLPKTQEIVGST